MKRALLVFPDEWIIYAPSVLNLASCLREDGFEVEILTFENNGVNNREKEKDPRYIVMTEKFSKKLMRFHVFKLYKVLRLMWEILRLPNREFDVVFGFDAVGFIPLKILFHKDKVIYFSLELFKNFYWKIAKTLKIEKLVIQSKEREDYLELDKANLKTVYVQNAPIHLALDEKINFLARPKTMIYFGLISKAHGVEYCMEALAYLSEYTLVVKGLCPDEDYIQELKEKHQQHVIDGRLIFEMQYVPQEQVISYLQQYRMGFCFYDFELISKNDFNYLSCPSGKLFNYYAAGVPVIGSDIIGLKSVQDFEAGVLLAEITGKTIADAVQKLEITYEKTVRQCLEAAKAFDFKRGYECIQNHLFK